MRGDIKVPIRDSRIFKMLSKKEIDVINFG